MPQAIVINNEMKDTGFKGIRPDINKNKGINLVHLEAVELKASEIKGDSNMIEFRGMEIPSISFVWAEIGVDKAAEPARHIERFMPLSKHIVGEYYENILRNQITQILHIVRKHVNLTDEEYAKLNVFKDGFNEDDADEVIKLFAEFYTGIYSVLHKTEKKVVTPLYKNIPAWLKLTWNSKMKRFGIPSNKSPFYEIVVKGKPSTLFIDSIKKETIIPDNVTKPVNQATPVAPNAGGQNSDFAANIPSDFFAGQQ